jgi:hypothetical protein
MITSGIYLRQSALSLIIQLAGCIMHPIFPLADQLAVRQDKPAGKRAACSTL